MQAEKDWTLTDDSCHQYRKQTGPRQYRFVEINALPVSGDEEKGGEDRARVREASVDLAQTKQEDVAAALSRYTKQTVEQFRLEHGDAADALIAEYLFEEHLCDGLGEKDFPSMAAAEFLEHYTAENLDTQWQYKESGHFSSLCFKTCYIRENPDSIEDCYTRRDFLELCRGDGLKAGMVFDLCEWQHPSTLLAQWDEEDEAALSALISGQRKKDGRRDYKKPFFTSPYDQYAHYNGLEFEVIRRLHWSELESSKLTAKYEIGKMYLIKLVNGTVIQAWPEEIFYDHADEGGSQALPANVYAGHAVYDKPIPANLMHFFIGQPVLVECMPSGVCRWAVVRASDDPHDRYDVYSSGSVYPQSAYGKTWRAWHLNSDKGQCRLLNLSFSDQDFKSKMEKADLGTLAEFLGEHYSRLKAGDIPQAIGEVFAQMPPEKLLHFWLHLSETEQREAAR